MTLTAWRIYKRKHSATAFTGEGARLYGGRFNSKGTAMVYTSASISLASLEMLVNLQASEMLGHYLLRNVTFDEKLVQVLDPKTLPRNWRENPSPPSLRRIGDEWVASNHSCILQVPSALVKEEANFLLNPAHPDFKKILIGPEQPHRFDPRLIKSS